MYIALAILAYLAVGVATRIPYALAFRGVFGTPVQPSDWEYGDRTCYVVFYPIFWTVLIVCLVCVALHVTTSHIGRLIP